MYRYIRTMTRRSSPLLLLLLSILLTVLTVAQTGQQSGPSSTSSSYLSRTVEGISDAFKLLLSALPSLGSNPREPTKITLVNVGIGRTGTKSFITALQELGYEPIHDDVFFDIADITGRLFNPEDDTFTPQDWADMAGQRGFDAMGSAVMLPYDFVEWAATQDDIKIVITLRDNARKWAESWITVNYAIDLLESRPFTFIPGMQDFMPAVEHEFRYVCTNGQPDKDQDLDTLIEGYETHLQRIRDIVPKDKLLEFNVKQGWEPLCNFLGKPIPDTPFPHVNDRVVMKALLSTFWIITWTWPILTVLMLYVSWWIVRSMILCLSTNNTSRKDIDKKRK